MSPDRSSRHRLPALLLAAMLSLAASTLPAAVPAADFDAVGAWRQFLATAGADGTANPYDALDVLQAVGYDGYAVDGDTCEAKRDQLADAVNAAPVSVAVHHAAMLCAQVEGDAVRAARESAALDALAALALSQAGPPDPGIALPIRVLSMQDIRTLLVVAGLEARYEYYAAPRPKRYLPYVVVVVDPDSGVERHLMFDVLDTMNAMVRGDPYSGYPMQRLQLAEGLVDAQAANGLPAAVDAKAQREAASVDGAEAKIDKLRTAAGNGGVQSMLTWLVVCQLSPATASCSSELVDALLAGAEQRQAVPMAMLAYAYAAGIGVGKDEAAAATLLDEADRRWPPASASGFVANIALGTATGDEIPAFFRARAERAISAGDRGTLVLDGRQRIARSLALDERQRTAFATEEYNLRGAGYELLARDALLDDDVPAAVDWTRRAAMSGNPWGQEQYGWRLRFGHDVARDRAAAQPLLQAAAHDAQAFAALVLAGDASAAGHWDEANAWLIAPASRGDVDSLMALAGLMVSGLVGEDKVAIGIGVYRNLAEAGGMPEARRRLASLAIEGRGMEKAPAQAEAWLREDAERGDHQSEAMLGGLYLRGDLGKVDEAEGRRWMERALAAGESTAFVEYGAWLYYVKDTHESHRRAVEIWSQGSELGDASAANNLAWALCTSPDEDIRDPSRGLEVSAKIGEVDEINAGWLDTVAACHAATGDYEAAVRMQQNAVDQFKGQAQALPDDTGMAETVKRAEARLVLYRSGKPYLETDIE